MKDDLIDYGMIQLARSFYEAFGYKSVTVPWLISEETMNITRPVGSRLFETFAGCCVASGEQSFLEVRKKLKPGKYQCVTPCFRDEQVHDELHLQYFIKLELIHVLAEGEEPDVKEMVNMCLRFFRYGPCAAAVKTAEGFDITINDIEVGSYGFREHDGFRWVFGTGIAEPRFTQATLK